MIPTRDNCIPENETRKLAGGDNARQTGVRRQIRDARPSRKPGIGPPRGDFEASLEKSHKTRTCWLGRQDSNLGMAESNPPIRSIPTMVILKRPNSGLFPINRLGGSSERCALLARGVVHATPSALPPFAHCRSLR